MHTCTHSESGCIATFGHVHPSLPAITWRTFHHKLAPVAPLFLWVGYFLCAHHTHFPFFQLSHACTHLFLPTWPQSMACTPPCVPWVPPTLFSTNPIAISPV